MVVVNSRKVISSFVFFCSFFAFFTPGILADNHKSKKTFYIADPHGRDTFRFESEAPLETIVGTTNHIRGEVILHPNNAAENLKASFEIDLTTIKTGIQRKRWAP